MNLRESLGRRVSAIPMRIGLVVATVSLAALALLVSGVAVTSALSRTLTARIDEQLEGAARSWAAPRQVKQVTTEDGHQLWVPANRTAPQDWSPPLVEQPRRFYELRKATDGQTYWEFDRVAGGPAATPDLAEHTASTPTTVGSTNGSPVHWRVLTITNQYGSTTIGSPLTENQDTVRWLIVFQTATGATVLLVLGVAGYFVVRCSLQPLRTAEETAAAIARGDLSRRVPVRGVDTEVDRLSQSLNAMLAQIQHGVATIEASEEEARRSEARMRRFIADASHELRTPLTTIRGFAELYRQGASRDPAMVLNRIEGEAERMGLLVEDLLILVRLDAQRPLDRTPVDLLDLAGDVVHSAQAMAARQQPPDAPNRDMVLEVRAGTGTLEVASDATRLRQVLANLIGNALCHTPVGTPITVRLTPFDDEIRIDVIDCGPGLSEEAVTRVFERFYRTDSSRTRLNGGTGLGLSIVRAIVAAHGGRVSVESEPGAGAMFTVFLPREVEAPAGGRPGSTARPRSVDEPDADVSAPASSDRRGIRRHPTRHLPPSRQEGHNRVSDGSESATEPTDS